MIDPQANENMSQDKKDRSRQLIEERKNAPIDGVAPLTNRGIGNTIYMRADRLGIEWADACEAAGVMTRMEARRGPGWKKPGESYELETLASIEEKSRKTLKQKREEYIRSHECVRCIWSRRVNERTVFCPAPKGYCMAKRKPGKGC